MSPSHSPKRNPPRMPVNSPGMGATTTWSAWRVSDQHHRRHDPPLPERVLEKGPVDVQANQEPVRGGVGDDEPDAVADDQRSDASAEDQAILGDDTAPLALW